jgi:type 1 glutamine amidotransferase
MLPSENPAWAGKLLAAGSLSDRLSVRHPGKRLFREKIAVPNARSSGGLLNMRPQLWFLTTAALTLVSVALSCLVPPATARAQDGPKPVRALLVIGGCCHDYKKQKDIFTKGISARANIQWTIAYDPDTGTKHLNPVYTKVDWTKGFDVVVHDECCADVKELDLINRILDPHRQGLPGVVLHCGMHSYRSEGWPKVVTPWFKFTGLQTTGHGPQEPIAVSFVDKASPITKGLEDWSTIKEELYNNISGKLLETATPLARGKQIVKNKGKESTTDCGVVWSNLYLGKTKVFATTLGHNNETVADGRYLDLVARGLLWSVGKLEDAYLKPATKVLIDE